MTVLQRVPVILVLVVFSEATQCFWVYGISTAHLLSTFLLIVFLLRCVRHCHCVPGIYERSVLSVVNAVLVSPKLMSGQGPRRVAE